MDGLEFLRRLRAAETLNSLSSQFVFVTGRLATPYPDGVSPVGLRQLRLAHRVVTPYLAPGSGCHRPPGRAAPRRPHPVPRPTRLTGRWAWGYASVANFLVNHRMDKSQQMRWTRCGVDLRRRFAALYTTMRSVPASGKIHPSGRYVFADGRRCLTPKREAISHAGL